MSAREQFQKFVSGQLSKPRVYRVTPYEEIMQRRPLTEMESGDSRVDEIRKIFYELEKKGALLRTNDQVTITEIAISRCGLYFYGDAYGMNQAEIVERNKWHLLPLPVHEACMIIAQRRMGKSVAGELFAAVMLFVCARIIMLLLAKSIQSAQGDSGFIAGVKKYLIKDLGCSAKVDNKQEVKYIPNANDERVMFAYRAGVDV